MLFKGSGGGSVSRAVASDTRGPQFICRTVNSLKKTKIQKKSPRMAYQTRYAQMFYKKNRVAIQMLFVKGN